MGSLVASLLAMSSPGTRHQGPWCSLLADIQETESENINHPQTPQPSQEGTLALIVLFASSSLRESGQVFQAARDSPLCHEVIHRPQESTPSTTSNQFPKLPTVSRVDPLV